MSPALFGTTNDSASQSRCSPFSHGLSGPRHRTGSRSPSLDSQPLTVRLDRSLRIYIECYEKLILLSVLFCFAATIGTAGTADSGKELKQNSGPPPARNGMRRQRNNREPVGHIRVDQHGLQAQPVSSVDVVQSTPKAVQFSANTIDSRRRSCVGRRWRHQIFFTVSLASGSKVLSLGCQQRRIRHFRGSGCCFSGSARIMSRAGRIRVWEH